MKVGPGHVIAGKYRLVEPLAAGGMGSVWRARHADLAIDVAVKVMSTELAGSDMAALRFKREARAAAMLKTPHVVQIHDYGVEEGHPYMVMELLSGEDLRQYIRREVRVSLARAVELIGPICKALRLAHEAGITHRDIKPANVFLARAGHDELVKVLDFGIAKEAAAVLAPAETSSDMVLGSPMYMSPEQARAGEVDQRSDLWSVGVVAFELMTGRHPFEGASLADVLLRICSDERPVPSTYGLSHPGLDDFFRKALARAADRRFASAAELSDTLANVALGRPAPADAPAADPKPSVAGAESEAPTRRLGRDSDTLALAATAPAGGSGETATKPPAPQPKSRAAIAIFVLASAAGIGSLLWQSARGLAPAGEGSQRETAATISSSYPSAPPIGSAAPEGAPAPPSAPPAVESAPAAPSRAGPAAPRIAATRSDAGAAPAAPSAAAPSVDPVFGVPVSKPPTP